MAGNKSVLELAVGTGQWDAGLKKAKQSLDKFTEANGGLTQALNKDSDSMRKFVTMMGQMDSTAKTSRGQLNDYKSVIEQLTMQYNRMTDAQKKSIGQDYLRSIDSLKQKYQSVNEEIQEMNRSLSSVKNIDVGGLTGGDKLSGALSVFGGNVMTKAFELTASSVVNFANEIGDCVKQGIELAKQGEGIRVAFERLGRGDILQGLREATHDTVTDIELMKAAVKFNDFKLPVEELGTMLAFAQQKAKDTGQSIDYMVDSIVTGLGRKSLMILDNLGLSAAEIKEKMAETGDMTKAVGAIIREQMAKAGDYVETAADRAARANVDLQNKMEELGRKFAPLQEASNNFWTSMKISILDIVGGPLTSFLNSLTEAGRLQNALNKANGGQNGDRTKVGVQLDTLRNSQKSGSSFMTNRIYSSTVEGYNRDIIAIDTLLKQAKGHDPWKELKTASEKFGQKFNSIIELKDYQRALQSMRDEYVKGARDIMKPVTVNIKTDNAENNVESLKVKLAELEAQRKKAIKAGDNDQVKNLNTQITQTKANIKALEPDALKTTHTLTKPEQAQQKYEQAQNDYNQALEQASLELKAGTITQAEAKKKELQAEEGLWKSIGGAREVYDSPKLKEAQANVEAKIVELGPQVEAAVKAQKAAEQTARELEQNQKKVSDALAKAATAYNTNDLKGYIAAQKSVGGDATVGFSSGTFSYTEGNLDAFIGNLKERVSQSDLGSDLYKNLTAQIADANALGNLMQISVQNGIDIAKFQPETLWRKIFSDNPGDYIEPSVWTNIQDEINKELAKMNIKPISIDVNTGGIKQAGNDAGTSAKEFREAASAVSQLGSALSSIEDPTTKVAGIIAQAVASVALTFAKSLEGTFTVWDWIAGAAAGTATMISTISAIKSATSSGKYANGGVIPGNSFSGDNLTASVNAGELILNKAQQASIAQELERGEEGGVTSVPYVTGEQIFLGLNNYLKGAGYGQLVTSNG